MKRRAGRVNFLAVLGILGILIIGVFFVIGGESASSVASRFFTALARGDAKALANVSYMPGLAPAEIEKKWEYTTQVVAPHYPFRWEVVNESRADETNAAVTIKMWKNFGDSGSYDERFGVPMVRQDGKWLVDVRGIPRKMFPGLPR